MAVTENAPRFERMEKCSEALTKGVALLVAVGGFAAARDGGLGRLIANGSPYTQFALLLAVASVGLAFLAWISLSADSAGNVQRSWRRWVSVSLFLFGLSVLFIVLAVVKADQALERPALSFEQSAAGLKFSATIERLKADQFLRTTVYGYPLGSERRLNRELLFNSTTGPDAKGKSTIRGVVTASLSNYEVVELRAFRGREDPKCERDAAAPEGPAACASLWIVPLKDT